MPAIIQRFIFKRKQLPVIASVAGFSAAFIFNTATAEEKKIHMEEIKQATELYDQNKFKEVYEYLVQFKDSEDPELLWRLIRATRDRAVMVDVSADDKKKMIFEAFEVSKRAVEFGEDNYACHKVYIIQ